MVVYSDGYLVVSNGIPRHTKAIFPTNNMHVYAMCKFAWIFRYMPSRYVFPIKMHFEGHLRHIFQSCGVTLVVRIRRSMSEGYLSELGCSQILLMVLEMISHG